MVSKFRNVNNLNLQRAFCVSLCASGLAATIWICSARDWLGVGLLNDWSVVGSRLGLGFSNGLSVATLGL